MNDIRDNLFGPVSDRIYAAAIIAEEPGILAGSAAAAEKARELGLKMISFKPAGARILQGETLGAFSGSPLQLARAGDLLAGCMAKPSGIATAARQFVEKAGSRPKIVCGAWKKMPAPIKGIIREAVAAGGAGIRVSEAPFVYLDKNMVKMLGGIRAALDAAKRIEGRVRVIQIDGKMENISEEAVLAARGGAGIIFIDSGVITDIDRVSRALAHAGLRSSVFLAYGGGITLADMDRICDTDADIVDVGRAIIDAPLLDMRLEVAADQ